MLIKSDLLLFWSLLQFWYSCLFFKFIC